MIRPFSRLHIGALSVIASAVFLWAATRHLNLVSVATAWRTTQPIPWLPLAAMCFVAGHLVRGRRLSSLIRRESTLGHTVATNVVVGGYASNSVLPACMGEFVRARKLAEKTGLPIARAMTVTLVERLLDGMSILLLLAISALPFGPPGWIFQLAGMLAVILGMVILALGFAVLFPRVLVWNALRASRHVGTKWHMRVLDLIASIVNGASYLRQPADALAIALLSILVWAFDGATFTCVLPAFGLAPRLDIGIVVMCLTNLGILIPSTPGFVGTFHFFCAQALSSQGIDPAVAFSYATLVHLMFYIPMMLWGVGVTLWGGVEGAATAEAAQVAPSSPAVRLVAGVPVRVIARMPPAASPPRPGVFELALTEALLPDTFRYDATTVREIADFVVLQVHELPAGLRVLHHAGMQGFRVWVLFRFWQGFTRLPVETQRRAVASWAYGRVAMLRQLFRTARSTALLAFYEHPAVAGELLRFSGVVRTYELPKVGEAHG